MNDARRLEPNWAAIDPGFLTAAEFPESTIIFDRRSGATHYLEQAAAVGFEGLRERPLSQSQLCDYLADKLDIPRDDTLVGYCEGLIGRLSGMGLVVAADD